MAVDDLYSDILVTNIHITPKAKAKAQATAQPLLIGIVDPGAGDAANEVTVAMGSDDGDDDDDDDDDDEEAAPGAPGGDNDESDA